MCFTGPQRWRQAENQRGKGECLLLILMVALGRGSILMSAGVDLLFLHFPSWRQSRTKEKVAPMIRTCNWAAELKQTRAHINHRHTWKVRPSLHWLKKEEIQSSVSLWKNYLNPHLIYNISKQSQISICLQYSGNYSPIYLKIGDKFGFALGPVYFVVVTLKKRTG